MLENFERLFLSMLLHVWAQACVSSLDLFVRKFVLVYAGLFLRICVCGFRPVYAGSCLRTLALTRIREMPRRSFTLLIFFKLCHFYVQS